MSDERLERIKARFDELLEALPLRPGDSKLELWQSPNQDACPYVEIKDDKLHYVVSERGFESVRKIARDEDEVLYWMVTAVVQYSASNWEAEHRLFWRDSRRRRFAKEVRMLKTVNPAWAERRARENERVLKGLSCEPPR